MAPAARPILAKFPYITRTTVNPQLYDFRHFVCFGKIINCTAVQLMK